MNEPSLRLRLTVWYTLALLVTLCLGAAVILREQAGVGMRRDQNRHRVNLTPP